MNNIKLHEIYQGLANCELTPYTIGENLSSILIFPGGGYQGVSPREGEPIAKKFNELGFNAFVLDYCTTDRFKDTIFPVQLRQAAAAMHYIRTNCESLNIGEKIAVCGFSAGGHLAGSISTLFYKDYVLEFLNTYESVTRPDASILCYPVISSINNPHSGSIFNITGGDAALMQEVSLEKQVSEKTPPTFIWHTYEDSCVDVSNTLDYAASLYKNKIQTEIHVYNFGCHGLSLATAELGYDVKHVQGWIDLAASWLKDTYNKN